LSRPSRKWFRHDFARFINLDGLYSESTDCTGDPIGASELESHARLMTRPFMARMYHSLDALAACSGTRWLHPYTDKELVELAVRLPMRQKMRNGYPKWILRRAATGVLPDQIHQQMEREHVGDTFSDRSMQLKLNELLDLLSRPDHPVFEFFDYSNCKSVTRSLVTTRRLLHDHREVFLRLAALARICG